MKADWNIGINTEGNLLILGKDYSKSKGDLFGNSFFEYVISIDAHHLVELRNALIKAFPGQEIANRRSLLNLIKEEFYLTKRLGTFRNFLESLHIPFRFHNRMAQQIA
jgi:hypothetical protein